MIVSASRRTDIPAFHADWMMRRLRAGEVLVRNPMNPHQMGRVSLKREDAEAIVFWTKDAAPMLGYLTELNEMGYRYLFQYTLTPYGQDIERQVDKRRALDALLKLTAQIGPERVIWRCDPILLTDEWSPERFLRAFDQLSALLEGASRRCVISFVDLYARMKREAPWIHAPSEGQMRQMAAEIARMARSRGMLPSACAETMDFTREGIEARGCIDPKDLEGILHARLAVSRDGGQRPACRCVRSVDIGAYDTCGHDCAYSYARHSNSIQSVSPDAPLLGRMVGEEDQIKDRREKRVILPGSGTQTSIFPSE